MWEKTIHKNMYTWYIDEKMETDPSILNKSTFYKSFSKHGEYTIRVVVSDLKGGISSKNLLIRVGEAKLSSLSTVSGTVRSSDGFIQGARVVLFSLKLLSIMFQQSEIIEIYFYHRKQ